MNGFIFHRGGRKGGMGCFTTQQFLRNNFIKQQILSFGRNLKKNRTYGFKLKN